VSKPRFIRGHFPDSTSLGEAREWARSHWKQGCICPICQGKVRRYERKVDIAAGKVMVTLYRFNEGRDYVHVPTLLKTDPYLRGTAQQGGYAYMGQHWGLIEAQKGERADGSRRTGWWRLTDKGRQFIRGQIKIEKKAYVYKGEWLGWADITPWSITDALQEPFDYRDL
jgi:hypothetical protein